MIAEIHKSRPSFKAILQYAFKPEKTPEVLGGNTAGFYESDFIKEFSRYENLNPRVKNPVFHASISLAEGEHLDDNQWQDVVDGYLQTMGIDTKKCPFVFVKHHDSHCEHVHIIASHVDTQGRSHFLRSNETYLDKKDGKTKFKKVNRGKIGMAYCRDYEKKHGLKTPEPQKRAKPNRPERKHAERIGQSKTAKEKILDGIDSIIDKNTFDLRNDQGRAFFEKELNALGIGVTFQKAGVAFHCDGRNYSGTKLGTDYKFKKLTARALHQGEPQQNAAIPAQARELPQKREPNYQKTNSPITDFYEILITFTTGIVRQILIWLKRARQKAEAEKRAAEQAQRELQKQFNFLTAELIDKIGNRLIEITENEIKRREAAEQKAAEQLQKTQSAAEYGAGSAAPFGSAESPNAEKSTSTSVNNEKPAIDEPPRAENTPPGKTLGGVEKSTMTTEKQTQSPTATPKTDNSTPPPEKRAAGVELTAEQKRAEQKERIKQKTAEIAAKINAEMEKEKREAAERKAAEIERQTQRTQQTSKRRGR